jgi:putative tetratricopeptide repeat-containing domain protein
MKGCVDLNLKRDYPAAREAFEKCLGYDANFLEANANMAYAYMNEVVTKRQDGIYKYAGKTTKVIGQKAVDQYNKEIAEIKGYYEKALPFMEKVRQLAPDRSKMWASALQQIYFNLGRKAEANQMDEIMSRSAHQ